MHSNLLAEQSVLRTAPYIAITLAVLLWMPFAMSKPIELICAAPQSSMYFTVTFDEETGHVLFEGLPTTKEVIDQNKIVFTMAGRDDFYGYVIDRLTGSMLVVNQRTGVR
jgi:hypothetical protein